MKIEFDQNMLLSLLCSMRLFSLANHDQRDRYSVKPCHRFPYQCQDNAKMYKHATLDQNKPCGSRVIIVFTNRPWAAVWMPGEAYRQS